VGFSPGPGTMRIDPSLRDKFDLLLESAVRSAVPWLDSALTRVLQRPSKRLRPALVLAAAECGRRPDLSAALTCAVAVELLHQSSLLHDDLMDEASFRGDQVTLYTSNGAAGAVLGGDYLLAAGGRLIASIGSEAALVWHEAYRRMCEGQARETGNLFRLATVEEYLETVHDKTGALIGAACQLGGLCGLDSAAGGTLKSFGEAFGVVFQVLDDLMDVLSTPELWGKPIEHDVAHGVYTLPVLFAADLLGPDLTDISTVYDNARAVGVRPTVATAYEWADRASATLSDLAPSAERDALAVLPQRYVNSVLTRRVASQHSTLVAHLLRG
jgi:geranylgeranyl pyrophosphate synthase